MRLGKPTTVYAWVDERVDHQIGDASALGRARIDAASASRARKAEISKRLAAENAEARRRNQGTALRTDADITDEAAGARRVELAAESKARKEAAAKYLAQKNRELARARASKGAATDFDITDDAAGFARVQMAEASEARRREKARRLAAANAEQRRRNTQTALRTDADITDEEAGARRVALAAESKRRRAAEARALASANAEMRRRLQSMKARTDNKKGRPPPPTTPAEVMAKHAAMAKLAKEQQEEEDEETEVQLLREMLTRTSVGKRNTAEKSGWDSRPHRAVPYGLRGMRPLYTIEPWSQEVVESSREQNIPPYYASTSAFKRLDDGLADDIVSLRKRRIAEDKLAASTSNRPVWNNEVWKTFPPQLRGLKPVTPEPWLHDLHQYQQRGSW